MSGKKPWVVYCEPPLGNAQQIVKYLGQYTHRVAISNHRIQNIDDSGVSFLFQRLQRQKQKRKLTKLSGVEFIRRFLPAYFAIPLRKKSGIMEY